MIEPVTYEDWCADVLRELVARSPRFGISRGAAPPRRWLELRRGVEPLDAHGRGLAPERYAERLLACPACGRTE